MRRLQNRVKTGVFLVQVVASVIIVWIFTRKCPLETVWGRGFYRTRTARIERMFDSQYDS